jgi:poly-gamma-glutamate synthesis protein (capsule biosynthesis protein)
MISRVSYLPCIVNKQGQPELLGNDSRGDEVFNYMEKITREAALNVSYQWLGDEVLVQAKKQKT